MIVVIGAGIAGLAAARELRLAGRRVIVLEAKQRLGGRVHTEYAAPDFPVELGASWIHGTRGNAVLGLAYRFGLRTIATEHARIALLDARRTSAAVQDGAPLHDAFQQVLRHANAYAGQHEDDLPLSEAITAARRQLDFVCLDRSVEWGQAWLSLIMGTGVDCLSAKHWDQDEELAGPDHVFPGGYSAVVEALARGSDVRCGQEVRRIEWNDLGVALHTPEGRLDCDHAICTIPLGVLQSGRVSFEPPLPESKVGAIQRLGMGVLDKVVMRFPHAFWPRDHEHLGCMPAKADEFIGFTNLVPYGQPPALVGWFAGRFARALEQHGDEHIVDRALYSLRSVLGERVVDPTYVRVTRWAGDPLAMGAYSHVPVGATGTDYDTLAEPLADRVLFAGEATYRRHPATVHGAYMSGVREARRLLGLLRAR